MTSVEIMVLGPIEVSGSDGPVMLRGRTERALLAALALSLNHSVSADHLIVAVWGDAAPRSARNTLHSAISRLRAKLPGVISGDGHSYRLQIDPDAVDAVRFERLVVASADALGQDPQQARALTTAAMDLWRGVPFGDLADDEFVQAEAIRLDDLRLRATEIRLAADVALGHLAQAIPRLRAELVDQPYRERLWYQLMVALARDGRRVEALRAYHDVWGVMRDVGLEPCRSLQELEQRIIDEDAELRAEFGGDV